MSRIPVKQGQEVKVHIISVNAHGQGVAKVEGYVIFVMGALPGGRLHHPYKQNPD